MAFRAILGADLHGSDRNTRDLKTSLHLYEDAYRLAVEHNVDKVYWLGDLLHYKYGMSAKLLLAWAQINKKPEYQHIQCRLLRGNHETPWKSEPELTPLALMEDVDCISMPMTEVYGNILICHLPWYPDVRYKEAARQLATLAYGWDKGPKFLFTHTSLAEGVASATNERIEGAIRLKHLFPEAWSQIYLGDYHTAQQVGPNGFYLGAPISRSHADSGCLGLWLLESDGRSWGLHPLELPSEYPEYHQVQLGYGSDLQIPGYKKLNNYLVTAPFELHTELRRMYPDNVRLKPLEGEAAPPHPDEATEPAESIDELVKRWLVKRGLSLALYGPIAARYLPERLE